MATSLKVTKKHHKHLNNPFPSPAKSLLLIEGGQGHLHFKPETVPSHQVFSIGTDFHLLCSSDSGGDGTGGYLSISHRSQPRRPIWSTIPGQAFVSAAVAETEVEESRGSFVIKDRRIDLICNHQTVEDVRVIDDAHDWVSGSGYPGLVEKTLLKDVACYPVLLVTGWIMNNGKRRRSKCLGKKEKSSMIIFDPKQQQQLPYAYAKYWLLFYQKKGHQIGFQVNFDKPTNAVAVAKAKASSGMFKVYPANRLSRIQRDQDLIMSRRSKAKAKGYVPLSLPSSSSSSVDDDNGTGGGQEAEMGKGNSEFNRVCFTYLSEGDERFYGFGEQFSHMDFKGKRVPILVQEQGIGRGDQPITLAMNLVSYRAGGDWSTTYAPSPFYVTSKMRSLYLEGYNYCVFDLTRQDRVQIQVHGTSVQGVILHGNSPTELIENFTETIGRPPVLPQWIISGAVVGMQGGTDAVRDTWDLLRAYDVPISAFWLQDWVGKRETFVGSQLWWNWEVDELQYEGWQELVKDLSSQHIKTMTYCNPCLAPTEDKANRRRNLFEEAKMLDILVKDKNGEPYMVPNTAFDVGMLDFTNPDTGTWFKNNVLQQMVDDGVRGWMADFGEGLPVDAILYSGEDPIAAHNRYPELWAEINREFVEEWKGSCLLGNDNADPEEAALVFFMRAGYRGSPKWAMLFWEGDQMVSWQKNDGIKSAVVGLLSGGISGYALNHSDIGGYCAVNFPLIRYHRSEELLLRWMELSAFTTIFRTHEGNKPSCNSQFYSNHHTLSHFARFAKVYKAWKFYRVQLVKEAAEKGLPICRHLFLHYPEDEYVHKLTYQQFLVGEEILVVPVLDKGKNDVKAYFPLGGGKDRSSSSSSSWKHIWTGKTYTPRQGSEARIEAPLGYPAIFIKPDSPIGQTFLNNLRELNLV
ncbi:hypothetical protein Dimus_002114 [Dionaea muscipula]